MKTKSAPPGDTFTAEERKQLLELAHRTVHEVVETGKAPDVLAADFPEKFQEAKGCFVTLTRNGTLRGCIGNLKPHAPLFGEVMRNAAYAATQDARFPPVLPFELDQIRIEISVLTPPHPLIFHSPDELLAKLRPRRDGVILRSGNHLATYLPQVWEKVPDKESFLNSLASKAGCPPDAWRDPGTEISTYQAECFQEPVD